MLAIKLTDTLPPNVAGKRLDQALSVLFPDYSRTQLSQWILSGEARVNGAVSQPAKRVQGGEEIMIEATVTAQEEWGAESLAINVVYADDAVIVLNKAPGVVVHPAAGHASGTLVNALLHHYPELATLPRAGIVHRLDKDTSGLMVVARHMAAHTHLVQAIQAHDVLREYQALVIGRVLMGGTVDAPVGRDPRHRQKMAVVPSGKAAVTHYRVAQNYMAHTLLQLRLQTGRTHQIRVHMTHLGYPLVGDPVYGTKRVCPRDLSETTRLAVQGFKRQALHAARLAFQHPISKESLSFSCTLPEDMQQLIAAMQ